MDRYLVDVHLQRLGSREPRAETGDCPQREGRGKPGTIREAQSLYLAGNQPSHHRITRPNGTFHAHNWRNCEQRGCWINKHCAPLTHGNDHKLNATIQQLARGVLECDFIRKRLSGQLLQFVNIRF